ncbi:hypothetical protein M413DRAFT_356069 [Hebeloma cylindrosporum]|uniref:Uncharacterized protein n=1 Tax=Hebeloma cylindrosporum TaxID=76867 RepID=A0A0C2Y403_HEBCY|nr:hypothetical protein M413DRAFT_356069 [Hebeloma cylindrosporum h7]
MANLPCEEIGSKKILSQTALLEEPPVNAKDVDNIARKVNTDSCVFNHFPGFPYFVRNISPFIPRQSYARSLFAAGHGYPLYDPMAVHGAPDDYLNSCGISIGDVGILSNVGDFVFAFNIFLPSDHPFNTGNTPDSFSPLEPLDESEIHTLPEYFPRGAVITSKGVKVTRQSESPLDISFRSSERLGGVLVLPEGAARQDASTDRIREYVARNAHEWAFFVQNRWHPAQNGSAYVITGVDKTSDCSTMAFHVPLDAPAKIIARYHDNALCSYDGLSVAGDVKPEPTTSPGSLNLCVFLRGIRIGVGRTEWIENTELRPENAELTTRYTELYYPPPRVSVINSKLRLWVGLGIDDPPAVEYFVHPFHISDIIGPMMLSLRPDASLVLIDDIFAFMDSNQSLSASGPLEQRAPLNFSCSKGATFKDFKMLVKESFESYDIVEYQGVLRLERKSKAGAEKVSWAMRVRHLFWPMHKRNWASKGFTELVRRGQHHMDTNRYLSLE